jgi:putative spermidine/putrescine transport system substrate-binding protein
MWRNIDRRGFLAGMGSVAAATGLVVPRNAGAADALVVTSYGGAWEKFFREEVVPPFEKETKGKINLAVGLSKDWLTNIRAAGSGEAPYDVVMTNEAFASIEREEGYFEPLPVDRITNMKDLLPIGRYPKDMSLIGIIQPIGLAYRSDLVKTPPSSWKDLWTNPEFKGRTALYTITNSAGYMFVLMMAQIFGGAQDKIDVAFAEIKKLKPFAQLDFSGTMEIQLTRGEAVVGPLDFPTIARMKSKGVPVDVVAPKEGVFMFEQVFSILKASTNKDLACRWIDYILRPDVQEKWVREFFISPLNSKVAIPDNLKSAIPIHGERLREIKVFDWAAANRIRDTVIERWNKEMA